MMRRVRICKMIRRMVVGVGDLKLLRRSSQTTTPRGYVPIAVGVDEDTKRFMVHTKAFCDANFLEFLCRSADEYGFRNQGVLRIPYEAKAFQEKMMSKKGFTTTDSSKMLKTWDLHSLVTCL